MHQDPGTFSSSQGEPHMRIANVFRKHGTATGVVLSLVYLNGLLNIRYPASDLPLWHLLKISPEVVGILVIVWLTAVLKLRFRPALYIPLTAGVIFLRLFRLGDILIPMYFFRPFNLYLDSRFLPDLFHLLYTTLSHESFFFWLTAAVALLAAMIWLIWNSFKTIHAYLSTAAIPGWIPGIFLIFILALSHLSSGPLIDPDRYFNRGLFWRVVEEIDFILQVKVHRTKHKAVIGEAIQRSQTTPATLDKLQGADVYLIFVESYGYTVYGDARHFLRIESDLTAIETALVDQGFGVASNFVSSPTYGGSSWLAHATLASGVHLYNQMRYNLLITSKIKTLARYFNEAGYRTVRAMPGTQWPWPQGEFYGFQTKYYAWHFDYQGPMYGWSTMPDQYVLDFIRRREMETSNRPLYVEFDLISSHAPFHRQPPYLADWSIIGNGVIYNQLEVVTFPVIWPDLSNAAEAYLTAIRYDLRVITEFIRQYIRNGALIIVLGDHQPNVQLTGENQLWSVPVHVISSNPDLLRPFYHRGFRPGLIPTQPPPHPGMGSLMFNFLEDFSTPNP